MLILNFDLCLHFCYFLDQSLILFRFLIDRRRKILDILVNLAALVPLLFDFQLQPGYKSVEFFDLAVFVFELALEGAVVLGLSLLSILFKRAPQLVKFLKGVSYFDLVLLLEHLSEALQLICEFSRLLPGFHRDSRIQRSLYLSGLFRIFRYFPLLVLPGLFRPLLLFVTLFRRRPAGV